jgi:hypothetical protein
MKIVHAVYEKGVFRPTSDVSLPERCEVEFEPRVVGQDKPTSRDDLWYRFLAGLAYTGLVASLLSTSTRCAFFFTFAAVFSGFLVCGGLGLWWLTLWARQKDARPGQFGIGSLLFLMVFGAIFCGTVRWIVVRVAEQQSQPESAGLFCIVALICLPLTLVSIPVVLRMMEGVLWTAAWFVKRPQVRRWILGQKSTRGRR